IGRFRSFGFIPVIEKREWCAKRERAFKNRLKRKGFPCQTFRSATDGDLGNWLAALPNGVEPAYDGLETEI
ncbi:MAG: hypothetical protein IIZ06_07980, partial [Kiritimatiellae bacterium]|nr:hypothetical protein [Kiritimatiellia bacterium]